MDHVESANRGVELVADGFFFTEGARWRDGRLWVSDFYDHVVLRIGPDGGREIVCEVPGQPSGLGFAPDGDLLVVSMLDRRLLRLHDNELIEVADLGALAPGYCNDMHVDALGRTYVGNFGSDVASEAIQPTVLLRVDPDGRVTAVADELIFPNGVAVTADGTMLVAETFAHRISAFDVDAHGGLANRRVWAQLGPPPAPDVGAAIAGGGFAPDGICLDAEGALWVADALGAGAYRVLAGGEVVDAVRLAGDDTAYAVALGGEDGRTLFLCAGPRLGLVDPAAARRGSIFACRVEIPGAAWA